MNATSTPQAVLLLGGVIMDHYHTISTYPQAGQDTMITSSRSIPGGSCLNAGMSLHLLGDIPYIASCIGNGQTGTQILSYLEKQGVSTDCIWKNRGIEDSGFSIVMVDSRGERTFFTYKGCESNFNSEMIPGNLIEQIGFIYLTGYYLVDSTAARDLPDFLREMKEKNIQLLFDPGPLCEHIDMDLLESVCNMSDWITPNENELGSIARVLGSSSPEQLIEHLQASGCAHVVVKHGKEGTTLYSPDSVVFQPAYPVEVVDTTGAGDCFAAGIIHAQLQGKDLLTTIRYASACGSLATTVSGPRVPLSLDHVESLMKNEGEIFHVR